MIRLVVFLGVLAVAVACGGSEQDGGLREDEFKRGGTLRVGAALVFGDVSHPDLPPGYDFALDPQVLYEYDDWELARCCLLRTLLSYNGRPTREGGTELRPDLATAMPEVSRDGLTWTFRLKRGLHYAPPFAETEINAQDFIRAIERVLRPPPRAVAEIIGPYLGSYHFYYLGVITGTQEFASGEADTISGMEAPDDHTLLVHLTQPIGDLGYRFTLPATAPIPPNASEPAARLGAAEGHERGYGRFLVASGPYMIAGSQELDFSVPAEKQRPVAGYVPGKSITLVRNPSWDRATDALRPAYVDRIEILAGASPKEAAAKVDSGELDLVWDVNAPLDQIQRYASDPNLEKRLLTDPADFVWAVAMNLAVPPVDDVHVRKAVAYAIDKEGLRRLLASQAFDFGPTPGQVAGHAAPNSVTANLLFEYDPYTTLGNEGDLERARSEMAKSAYDRDRDGVCDHRACRALRLLVWRDGALTQMAALIERNLQGIGIDLEVTVLPSLAAAFEAYGDPTERFAMAMNTWTRDYPNGSAFFVPAFHGSSIQEIGNRNLSLLGASPKQLKEWGYSVTSVPSIDAMIEDCLPLLGHAQVECWAELDQLITEQVVPWVPFVYVDSVVAVSSRVASYTISQFNCYSALEQIALAPGST